MTTRKGRTRPANLREQVDPEAVKIYKESSSWRTPRATEYKNPDQSQKNKERGLPVEHLSAQAKTWRTPSASDPVGGVKDLNSEKYKNADAPKIKLRDQSASWPTPRNQDSYERSNWKTIVDANTGGKTQMTLTRKVKYEANQNNAWPTPRMNDFKGHCTEATTRKDGKCRNDQLQNAVIHTGPLAQAKQKSGNESSKNDPTSHPQLKKRLNPNFVEWLMGVPIGWSLPMPVDQNAYKLWETESSRLLEQLH